MSSEAGAPGWPCASVLRGPCLAAPSHRGQSAGESGAGPAQARGAAPAEPGARTKESVSGRRGPSEDGDAPRFLLAAALLFLRPHSPKQW